MLVYVPSAKFNRYAFISFGDKKRCWMVAYTLWGKELKLIFASSYGTALSYRLCRRGFRFCPPTNAGYALK